MNIEGAYIYQEGVSVDHDCQEKIRQIVGMLKTFSPSPEVSLRFVKSGRSYEGLLWGKANGIPLGAYNRGASMTHVVNKLHERVKRECLKGRKANILRPKPNGKNQTYDHSTMALAG